MHVYLKNKRAKFHLDSTWNGRALGFLKRVVPTRGRIRTKWFAICDQFLIQKSWSARNALWKKIKIKRLWTRINKKAVLSQRWPRNAPYTWVPWKISGLPDYAHGYNSQHCSRAFVHIDPLNVPTKFEVPSFIRSWDNRGYPKIWAVSGYAHAPFSPKFVMGFYSNWPCKWTRQIWSP